MAFKTFDELDNEWRNEIGRTRKLEKTFEAKLGELNNKLAVASKSLTEAHKMLKEANRVYETRKKQADELQEERHNALIQRGDLSSKAGKLENQVSRLTPRCQSLGKLFRSPEWQKLFLWEAIADLDQPDYDALRESVTSLGVLVSKWRQTNDVFRTALDLAKRGTPDQQEDERRLADAGHNLKVVEEQAAMKRQLVMETQLLGVRRQLQGVPRTAEAALQDTQDDTTSRRSRLHELEKDSRAFLEQEWPTDIAKMAQLFAG